MGRLRPKATECKCKEVGKRVLKDLNDVTSEQILVWEKESKHNGPKEAMFKILKDAKEFDLMGKPKYNDKSLVLSHWYIITRMYMCI